MVVEAYAHSANDDGQRHELRSHLFSVARAAQKLADKFGAGDLAYYAGLWHDLGKCSEDFQQMIRAADSETEVGDRQRVRVNHSTAGAIYAVQTFNQVPGLIPAYAVAGHHAGLADWQTETSGVGGLAQRIEKSDLLDAAIAGEVPPGVLDQPIPLAPKRGYDPAFLIRMVFSCLVDADFLDTEAFFAPAKASARTEYPTLSDMLAAFTGYMNSKMADAEDTPVNRIRAAVFAQSVAKAKATPGIFTLTVPTGGGKTLASMAFALHHALAHGKDRIIYVIPYTSIVEQTADVFRKVFGDVVVEHHSNIEPLDENWETDRRRLACENWDAPIIVTTNVQFFESLFASRTSRSRKLHNVANSVVIIDEAQMLPPEFLTPILNAMRTLVRNYNVTFILSTATQPALRQQASVDFNFPGLPNTVEIVDDPAALHRALKRVDLHLPDDLLTPKTWTDLAKELKQHDSVLCIVNRRDDCRMLYDLMSEGTIHLSALMCGAHRSEVIQEIIKRLKAKQPTRVISTQLVEAGVDVDFPVVYRALAGLDSIAQAAGRCNREGSTAKGQMFVFIPSSDTPPGHLRQAAEIGRRLLAEDVDDLLAPERFERFFKELYWLKGSGLDKHGIGRDLAPDVELRFSFRTAAGKFKLIDESKQASVLVRYGAGAELIEQLKRKAPDRLLLRKLQRYIVNLPRYLHQRLLASGDIIEMHPGIYAQAYDSLYQADVGFCPDRSAFYEPDDLISS